ncbi:hypothetical protein [Sorangium sp. So ce1182]|uniref:hypothetical protein n=1 Tax=Sorangium sp. So ce1182 TaxID=3133334 RepID=UPI003F5DE3F3
MLETRGLTERFQALAAQGMLPAAIVKGIVGPMAGQQLRDDVTVMVIRYSPANLLTSELARPVDGWSRPL